MRNLSKIALYIFSILTLPTLGICQTSPEIISAKGVSPYKTMNLKFVLYGSPTPEDVGFNNPKSFWRFRYELRFLNERFPFQYFKENENESQKERAKRIRKNNKAYDKGWRKYGGLVAKGTVAKTRLISDSNREITILVNLTPEITDILIKAGSTWQNPYFRISLTGKVSTQTNSNLKFKRKITQSLSVRQKYKPKMLNIGQ